MSFFKPAEPKRDRENGSASSQPNKRRATSQPRPSSKELFSAIRYQPSRIEDLIRRGADVNAPNPYQGWLKGQTALQIVIKMVDYRLTLIPLLLDAGASVEGISIFDAVRSGSPELLQKVIDAGADVNATDVYRNSPLHISRVPEITRMLIERGANVHATNSRGQTPLVYTVQRLTNDENVQVLLDARSFIKWLNHI